MGLSDIALNVHIDSQVELDSSATAEKKVTRHVIIIIETLPSALKRRQIQVEQRPTNKQTNKSTNEWTERHRFTSILSPLDQFKYQKWLFRSFQKCYSTWAFSSWRSSRNRRNTLRLWIMTVIMDCLSDSTRCNVSNESNSPVSFFFSRHAGQCILYIYLFSATCFGAIVWLDWCCELKFHRSRIFVVRAIINEKWF